MGQVWPGLVANVVAMLGPMVDEDPIRQRWLIVRDELDERGRGMWAAAEARSHGRGGIAAVVRATGISEATVRRGIAEVNSGQRAPEGRVRRPGAGRRSIEEREPGLREALLALLEDATRGDPESPLLWTSGSVQNLTAALRAQGFDVHESTVRRQLRGLGSACKRIARGMRVRSSRPRRTVPADRRGVGWGA